MEYVNYFTKYAAAYIRGIALRSSQNLALNQAPASGQNVLMPDQPLISLPQALLAKPLDELSEEDATEILKIGDAAGLKIYRFKNSHDELPRVRRVLGFLKSIEMNSLLDVGSGRGVFLWPCLNAFPNLDVHSVDLLPHWVGMLNTVRLGGVSNLSAEAGDFCSLALDDKSYDVVTLLEVLEHIPDVSAAVRRALWIARKYVVVTVPSKPDNNPEHIHLLTKEALADVFTGAGCARLHFDAAPGHIFLVAVLDD